MKTLSSYFTKVPHFPIAFQTNLKTIFSQLHFVISIFLDHKILFYFVAVVVMKKKSETTTKYEQNLGKSLIFMYTIMERETQQKNLEDFLVQQRNYKVLKTVFLYHNMDKFL